MSRCCGFDECSNCDKLEREIMEEWMPRIEEAEKRIAALEGLLRKAEGALTELLRPCLVCEGPKGAITNAQCNCNEALAEGYATLAALRAENGGDHP